MVIYKLFLIFVISNVIYVGPKKSSLVSRIGQLKNFCYHLPAGISRMCMRIYTFCFKKTQTKKFPLANLFVRIYFFSLQTIRERKVPKKSSVKVLF